MAKYAIIENGAVTNVVRAASKLEDHWRFITNDADVQIGDTFDGSAFSRPEPVVAVPARVTVRQARLALLGAGLLTDAETALNGLSSPQKEAALIEWEYAQNVERNHSLIAAMATALELTDAEVDQLFITAATL